jgi:hypothetical protein
MCVRACVLRREGGALVWHHFISSGKISVKVIAEHGIA